MDHSTAMTRASRGTGEGRWIGKLQPQGWGGGVWTTGLDRKSKPMMKADTPSENSNSKENIQNCSLINTQKENKHETTEKSSKSFKYQPISQ